MSGQRGGAAILMYHRVSERDAEPVEGDYVLPTGLFEGQLEMLAEGGVPVVALSSLALPPPPGRRVVLTFDDGCETDASVALELLEGLGFPATFFVNPARIGSAGHMSWSQLRRLVDAGMQVGSHGLDHALLGPLAPSQLAAQLSTSKRILEERLGIAVEALSLPGGSGGSRVARAARELGYRVVLGSQPGLVTGPPLPAVLPRFAVRRSQGLDGFRALVEQRRWTRWRLALRWRATRALRTTLGTRGWAALREWAVTRRIPGAGS